MIDIRPLGLTTHHDILDRKSIEADAELTVSSMSLDELILYINELQKLQTHARFVELVATKRKHKIISELPDDDERITKVREGVRGTVERATRNENPANRVERNMAKLNDMLAMMETMAGRKFTEEEKANFFAKNQ